MPWRKPGVFGLKLNCISPGDYSDEELGGDKMEMITKMSKPIFLAVGSVLLIALGVILGQSVSSIVNAHGGDPNSLHFCVNTDNGLIIMVRGDTDCDELRGNWQPVDKTVGSLVSPNGEYSLSVADDGINMSGPGGVVTIDATSITIQAAMSVNIAASTSVNITSSNSTNISSAAMTNIDGAIVNLNGSACPVARVGDITAGTQFTQRIVTGSATVSAC